MKFVEFSVKHTLFVNLLSVFFVVAGLVSMFELKREAFPEVSFDTVTVSTFYRGATPEEVEKLVSTPLEKELKEVDNIKDMYSASSESSSLIVLEMDEDATDKKKIVDDIQKAVDRVVDLPEGVDNRPLVTEITSKEIPVIKVGISGEVDETILRYWADDLKESLEDIDGVASVSRRGWRNEEFWVEPDLAKLKSRHVSIDEIVLALKGQNVAIPAGKIHSDGREFMIKTSGEFFNAQEIGETVVRSNDAGERLKVRDVAFVRQTFEDEVDLSRVGGTRSITLVVIKRESGDAIKIVSQVNQVIDAFKKKSPGEIKVSTFNDLSFYIKRRLNVLKSNGFIGVIFVVLVLFLFLHPIPAILTSLGIPIALLTTFYAMNLLGMSINLITMFGLIVVLGMLVDDGIIISENVYRYVEMGYPPREAAVKGTSEVMAPVTATVLTTIAAFSPLLFMSGLLGRFMRAVPMVVIVALAASLIEAFVVLPSHLADFCHPIKVSEGKHGKGDKPWFKRLVSWYVGLLNGALNRRYFVFGGTLLLFFFCIFLAVRFMPFVLFSGRGVEEFYVRAEASAGTSLEKMKEMMVPVEEFISKMPTKYLDIYETRIGGISEERGFDPASQTGSNLSQITVYLTPTQKRGKSADDIIDEMRPGLEDLHKKIPGLEKLYFRKHREGPPVGSAIDVRVRGEEYSSINQAKDRISQYLKSIDGVIDLSDSYKLGLDEYHIVVDREKASSAFVSVNQVASTVRGAIDGVVATTIKPTKAEEEIDVLVRLPREQRDTFTVFENLLIANRFGDLVPLKKIARTQHSQNLRSITHLDGKRYISVTGEVDSKKITSVKVNGLLAQEFKDISREFSGLSLRFGGEQEQTVKSMKSLMMAFWIAFLLIFLILATQFNSLSQPFIVMLTIPFGMIGVILAFLLHGESLSFFAIMGIVGLTGVVVNDSIVFVDFINKLRAGGMERRLSILEAGRLRLRPVILTTVTTIAGLSTVAYGIGGSDPFLKPMALAITWGLFFSTALTLVVIPCVYAILDDVAGRVKTKLRKPKESV